MSLERIGSFAGTGQVLDGDQNIATVSYRLEIYQNFDEGSSHSGPYRVPGLKSITGAVNPSNLPMGRILKLVTKEGNMLNFFLKTSDGEILGSGPLLNAQGDPL
jgi:hypothetical protein